MHIELITFVSYTCCAVLLAVALTAQQKPQPVPTFILFALLLGSVLLHTASLVQLIFVQGQLNLGVANVLSLAGWFAGLLAISAALLRMGLSLAILLTLGAAVCALMPILFYEQHLVATTHTWMPVHILTAISGFAMASYAAVGALIGLLLERALRSKQNFQLMSLLPPLETVERILFTALALSCGLLLVAFVTGLFFVTNLVAQHLLHKTVLTGAALLIFVGLLLGRHFAGWRGQQAFRYMLSGYVVLGFGYFGSKFILEVLLDKQWG